MNDITREVDALVKKMDTVKKFNDDIFIEYFEKVGDLQERLEEKQRAGVISDDEYKACYDKLTESFERLKGRLSFCNLS